jgi:ketosteroid isomerase-like protein
VGSIGIDRAGSRSSSPGTEAARFDLKDLRVSAGDTVAFATALLECAGTADGERVEFTLRLTVGLENIDGARMIVHEHHSEPIRFDQSRLGNGAGRA